MNCLECQAPIADNGVAACARRGDPCGKSSVVFDAAVEEGKKLLDLHMLAMIERNEMPACFSFTRATGVAMAGLLMAALRQNQQMAGMLKNLGHDLTKPGH